MSPSKNKLIHENFWNRFAPKVICIESSKGPKVKGKNGIDVFLQSKGYVEVWNNKINTIYAPKS